MRKAQALNAQIDSTDTEIDRMMYGQSNQFYYIRSHAPLPACSDPARV